MQALTQWFQRRFIGTELGSLVLILLVIILLFWWLGKFLAPVLISIVIAYLLDGLVRKLQRWKFPYFLAVNLVFLLFLGSLILGLLVLLPLIWDQSANLLNELPVKVKQIEVFVTDLAQRYPSYISKAEIQKWIASFQSDFARVGKVALTISISTISNVVMLVIYLVLVPLMVYFFMKDRDAILRWLTLFLPKKRQLTNEVWQEVNQQIGNYIRAKILEIIIVAIAATIAFLFLGLNYAVLLGFLVGLSVLIPYVGVIIVTVPVVVVGYLQWGFHADFVYLVIVYSVLMIVDGNILTPLLFSETLKLHPAAVIIAILIFGNLWGFWGIFFAIPLASVCKALMNAWLQHGNLPAAKLPS
ncbi:MAG TPA: AI-2E family transporter [Gammaproteobacteria bacterium]|nr:AI-2E family transporter [Gammaproteobacteria bacterium]